jgi:glycosyltransferase involved in cell wall biosynthesis
MRGGERVLESLCRLYPDADIFTNVYVPSRVSDTIKRHRVRTTFIQQLPFAGRWYQRYLPLMPLALEKLDLRGYRLVISSEAGPAKNVIVDPEALHVCYCHSPMRYIWDLSREYTDDLGALTRAGMNVALHYLRMADVTSAARVDGFIANSRFVAQRIRKYWRREAVVVPPPVDTKRFRVTPRHNGTYLWLGQLTRYKRPDIAVDAFSENGKPLVVAGDGPEMARLRRRAGKNVTFHGWADDAAAVRLLENCRALVFTGIEDFGIVPLEAMACGKPVIAYRRGG